MKNRNLSWLIILFLGMVVFSSCNEKTENQSPLFESIVLSSDNKTATVTFSEAVYANADMTGNLLTADIIVTIPGVDFSYEVTHVAGAKTMTIDFTITSITNGTEVVTVKPASATSIYDAEGLAMTATTEIVSTSLTENKGIIGNWYSSGENVAPLLVTYFHVDSIYAEFEDDNTYLVEQYNEGNTSGIPDVVFTGTFTIEKSTVGEIWEIVLTQENPYAADASGIFEIKTTPEVLWYEVVQTSGTANVPPTPETGFGSSNGGAFGTTNIQKFIRIAQ